MFRPDLPSARARTHVTHRGFLFLFHSAQRAALCAGSIGAARNKAGLQKAGIHFILNASPVVPCFHGGVFQYKTIHLYDDHDEDIQQYFAETNDFIEQVPALRAVPPARSGQQSDCPATSLCGSHSWTPATAVVHRTASLQHRVRQSCLGHLEWQQLICTRPPVQGRRKGAGVLVHCYAGRSRSAALILAYLMACAPPCPACMPDSWSAHCPMVCAPSMCLMLSAHRLGAAH